MTDSESRGQSDRPLALWGMLIGGVLLLSGAAAAIALQGLFSPAKEDEAPVRVAAAATPAGAPAAPAAAPAAGAPAGAGTAQVPELDYDEMHRVLGALSSERRAAILGDPKAFNAFVAQEAARRAVLRAAYARNMDEDDRISFLMQRGAEQVLVETYLQLASRGRIDDAYPSAEELRAFYDANKERYALEERVPIWQVFLPVPADADATAVAAIEADAATLVDRLRSGDVTFAAAAASHSGHEQSRVNGGYMGLLSVSSLVPEVRERIAGLAVGEISDPVRGSAGFHIIRRGERLPAGVVPLDQIEARVRADARRIAAAKLRLATMQESRKRFGEPLTQDGIEQWRERLQQDNGK